MKIVKQWLSGRRQRVAAVNHKRLQEQLDVYKTLLLLEQHANTSSSSEAPHGVDNATVTRLRALDFERQKTALQGRVHEQAVGLFEALHQACQTADAEGSRPSDMCNSDGSDDPATAADGASDNHGEDTANTDPDDGDGRPDPDQWNFTAARTSPARAREAVQGRAAERAKLISRGLREQAGFSLRVSDSLVPVSVAAGATASAGRGLFLEGSAPAGTVLCLYPGSVYLPLDLAEIKTEREAHDLFRPGNLNLLSRFDGTVIDAGDRMEQGIAAPALANPLASGQFINHPPPGTQPNVISCAYDVPSEKTGVAGLDEALRQYVPNAFARSPGMMGMMLTQGAFALSIAFVATTDLEDGDEILSDYRLNPSMDLPDWYEPVDVEESERRWAAARQLLESERGPATSAV